jgi:hypothetical protein
MTAKPYTLLTVRMPPDLHSVLEAISAAKGETVSTIVRDMVRKAAGDIQRGDAPIDSLGVSPIRAKSFR